MGRIKTLIHVHTHYSFDSDISLDTLARFLERERYGCVAVTDHDTIEGARRLRSMTSAKVIVGEEISTTQGHLIGLFLDAHIPPGMSAAQTAEAIHRQGGLVLLPHPYAPRFTGGIRNAVPEVLARVDAVEVNNAQSILRVWDRRAQRLADLSGLPRYVGADCHSATSIAPCHQMLPDFDGPRAFLESLGSAEFQVGYHSPAYFAATAYRDARYLLGMGLPDRFGSRATVAA